VAEKTKERKGENKMDGEVLEDKDKKRMNCPIYLYSCYQAVPRRCLKPATHNYTFVRG